MKAQFLGNAAAGRRPRVLPRGVSTLELLIAFAVLTLSITAVILVFFSSQSIATDTETNIEAVSKARGLLESARARARADWSSVASYSGTETSGPLAYETALAVADLTECKKQATSTVSWAAGGRALVVDLTTYFTDPAGLIALGGDCGVDPPSEGWTKPRLFAAYTFNPGQPTAIDVLKRIVYMPNDHGKLNIVDTSGATLGYSGNFLSPPFDAGTTLNDIDVAENMDIGKTYLYAARNDTAKQFEIIDVTNIASPAAASTRSLAGVNPLNPDAQGWRVTYYGGYAYVGTRYMGGAPEFHIFDVGTATNPEEKGSGTMLGTSIYGIVVRDQGTHRLAYLVTSNNSKELIVLDVTDPMNVIPLTGAYTNLPGNKDGRSIYVLGNRVYLGLESGGGSDFYVLDASTVLTATTGLPIIGEVEMGAGATVSAIRVRGNLAFLATEKSNDEFQVWNISNPAQITRIDVDPIQLPNKLVGGIDYENPYIYVGSHATAPLQILYSAP